MGCHTRYCSRCFRNRPSKAFEQGNCGIQGLFAFSTMEEIIEAVERINSGYERHQHAATELANQFFSYDVVLRDLMTQLGM